MGKKFVRSLKLSFFFIFIAAVAGLYIYIYVVPKVTGSFTETAVLCYGRLTASNEANAVMVRSETVVSAPQSGTVSYYIEEGAKTRKSAKVLDIYSPSGNAGCSCPETGFVSYCQDGLEEFVTEEAAPDFKYSDFFGENPKFIPKSSANAPTKVKKGEPLYKVVNSDTWHMAAFMPRRYFERYERGMSVTAVFEDGSETEGEVEDIIEKDDKILVIIKTKHWHKDFAKMRLQKLTLITSDKEGLLVPTSALAKENGIDGVYVKGIDGGYDFTRVKVLVRGAGDSLLFPGDFTEEGPDGKKKNVKSVSVYDEVLRDSAEKKE